MDKVEKARAVADAAYYTARKVEIAAKAAWLMSEQADKAYELALQEAASLQGEPKPC